MYQERLDHLSSNGNEVEIVYTDTNRDDITFHGKKNEDIHRWYLLTAAYAPALVRRCLSKFTKDGITNVLDPFSGTGTTVLESKKQGYDAVGVEFNPVYKEVAETKTTWDLNTDKLRKLESDLFDTISQYRAEWDGVEVDDFADAVGVTPPQIYNRDRWWHGYVLRDLLAARESIPQLGVGDEYRRFFRVALLGILIEVSNATYNHVSLSYMDEPPEDVDTLGALRKQIDEMILDLEGVHRIDAPGEAEVRRGDSTQLAEYADADEVDTIITSPPYPNRYSYMRETRPHLFFFQMVDDAGEVGEMALDSIGGTWGRATSQLEKVEIEPTNDLINTLVSEIATEIGEEDKRMENYVWKYFNKMEKHLQGVDRVVNDENGKIAYTVGNSKLKGIEVPTDEILAEMFKAHGFTDALITRERKRNSKSGLYEAVVFGRREG